jgi:DNA-binding GntR family transcriptional regulator
MPRLHKSAQSGLAEKAYSAIREQILRGQLRLGAVLSRRQLAQSLGMSILPVSEAIQRLESEGLIESKPQVGTRVRIPTETDIRDRFVIREALEVQSARLVADRATFQQRRDLQRMAEDLDALYNRRATIDSDPEFVYVVHSYHLQLHMRIAEYSGCGALMNLLDQNNLLVLNWMFDLVSDQPPLPAQFHRDLMTQVTGRSSDAAEVAMRQHVQYGLEETVAAMARYASASAPEDRWRIRGLSEGTPSKASNPNPVVASEIPE